MGGVIIVCPDAPVPGTGRAYLILGEEDPGEPFFIPGISGTPGPIGLPGKTIYLEPEEPELPLIIPGVKGDKGDTGDSGSGSQGQTIFLDSPDQVDEPLIIPGAQGLQGLPGDVGPAGISQIILLPQDEVDEPQVIPGPPGVQGDPGIGTPGADGANGKDGSVIFLEPELPEDPLLIPGIQGLTGPASIVGTPYSASFNATSDWGSASGGLYSIAFTHGLDTESLVVNVWDSDGNAIIPAAIVKTDLNTLTISVSSSPDDRFAGSVVVVSNMGVPGVSGEQGVAGNDGLIIFLEPDLPDDPPIIPGQPGKTGPAGGTGSTGSDGTSESSYLWASALPVVNGTLGNRFYADHNGTILWCMLNIVNGDGSITDAQIDVLKNGSSIYPSATKPSVSSGNFISAHQTPDTTSFSAGDYFQISVISTGNTAGRLRAYIHFVYA